MVAVARADPRAKMRKWLQKSFALRVHMALILAATFAASLLATKILLSMGVYRLPLRYAIATIAGYAGFLILIKLWLYYVGLAEQRASSSGVDIDLDDCLDFSGGGSGDVEFSGGGGSFGGGGSSGSWGVPDVSIDSDDLVVVLLFLALSLAIILAAVWLIWAAPAILGDAAFESALAAALIRHTRKASCGGWIGSIAKSTILPFALILALAITAGWFAQKHCPSARKLREAIACVAR
jgi:hypothetical protein